MDKRSHVLAVDRNGGRLTSITHPTVCDPQECPYAVEDLDVASLPKGLYKVTGGDSPEFERLDPEEDDEEPGSGALSPAEMPAVYSIVEDS